MSRLRVWKRWTPPPPLLSAPAAAAPPPPWGWRLHPECCRFILRPAENRWIRRDQHEPLWFPSLRPPGTPAPSGPSCTGLSPLLLASSADWCSSPQLVSTSLLDLHQCFYRLFLILQHSRYSVFIHQLFLCPLNRPGDPVHSKSRCWTAGQKSKSV